MEFVAELTNPLLTSPSSIPHPEQCFHTEGWEPGIPAPKLNFPLKLCQLLPYICIPTQAHHVPYLIISKIMILYETLPSITYIQLSVSSISYLVS